jgi:hypothetical protein
VKRGKRGTCLDHDEAPAVARCVACDRALCNECFRFRMREHPACARCAYEASTRPRRRVSLAAAFLCTVWGGCFWAVRRYDLWDLHPVMLVAAAVAAPLVAFAIAASAREPSGDAAVENRDPNEDDVGETSLGGSGSPFRAGVRRVLLAASPQVSGTATALVVGASLVASAVLLPASVKLPRWIEAELVLGLWWVIVLGTLATLLYRGFRLRDDYVYFLPWDRPAKAGGAEGERPARGGASGGGSGCSGIDGCNVLDGCSGDGEGMLAALVVGAALAVALGAAWVFVELAMPLVFFLMYALLLRAIGRVAKDHHDCAGAPGRSLGWGALWATIYVAPIALVTWLFHAVHAVHPR